MGYPADEIDLEHSPGKLIVCENNRPAMRNKLRKYTLNPETYDLEKGRVHIPCPPLAYDRNTGSTFQLDVNNHKILSGIMPKVLLHKFDNLISKTNQDELLARWARFIATNPTAHNVDDTSSARSTDTRSFHFGVWRRSSATGCISTDTRSDLTKEQKELLDRFLVLVKDYVGKRVRSLMEKYMPEEWEMRKVMWSYLKKKNFTGDREVLDFHEAFTTVAVTDGISDIIHTDRSDAGMTWVFPIGDWEGADLCLNQMGKKVEVRPGDGVAFHANFLSHNNSKLKSGKRVALTCFVDRLLFLDAMKEAGYIVS